MSLPKLSVSKYTVKLPITEKQLTVRPYLMKEEKLLMMAFESGDANQIVSTMASTITNCIDEEINVYDLPMVDAEYLLVKLKSFSRGETIDITMRCNNKVKDEETKEIRRCGNMVELNISLEDMDKHIDNSGILPNTIELGVNVGVTLRPPRFNCLKTLLDKGVSETDHIMNVLIDSIESIWTKDEVFPAANESVGDLQDFIDEMDAGQFGKLKDYFASIPEIAIDHNFECPKCKHKEVVHIRDLNDFFV